MKVTEEMIEAGAIELQKAAGDDLDLSVFYIADANDTAEIANNLHEKMKEMFLASLKAALSIQDDKKPAAVEYRHPEWLWYCESTTGPIVTFGRWAKNSQQKRYKIAEIQPTEHDHPTPSVSVKALDWVVDENHIQLQRADYYTIQSEFRQGFALHNAGTMGVLWFPTEEEAKEAAQAEYEYRIRSALL